MASIFYPGTAPAVTTGNTDTATYTMGTVFRSSSAAWIYGVRWYTEDRSFPDGFTAYALLYEIGTGEVRSKSFPATNLALNAWNMISFDAPYRIRGGSQDYIIAVLTNRYAYTAAAFAADVTAGDITAPGTPTNNGRFNAGSTPTLPTSASGQTWYGVDVELSYRALTNAFEGTGGTGITVANSDDVAGNDGFDTVDVDGVGTIEYSTTHYHSGATASRFATSGTSASPLVAFTTGISNTTAYCRVYLYLAAIPASNTNIFRLLSGSTIIATIRINSTGKAAFLYSSGTLGGTSTTSVPTGQWVRIEMRATAHTSTGSVDVRLYLGVDPDTETITETLSVSSVNTGSTSPITACRFGILSSVSNTELWMDDAAFSETGWVGGQPSPVPRIISPGGGFF